MPPKSHRYQQKVVEQLIQSCGDRLSIFQAELLDEASGKLVKDVIDLVPEISRKPLAAQASRMHGRVRAFLTALGRPAEEDGMEITGIDIKALKEESYSCGDAFSLTPKEIRELADAATVTYIDGEVDPDTIFQLDVPEVPQVYFPITNVHKLGEREAVAFHQERGCCTHVCSSGGAAFSAVHGMGHVVGAAANRHSPVARHAMCTPCATTPHNPIESLSGPRG